MSNTSEISATMTIEEYLEEREFSYLPVILVEGDSDSIFFQLVQDELMQQLPEVANSLKELQIDTPHFIKSPAGQVLGHREKVEMVCQQAADHNFKGNLVGFVDREFRLFQLADPLIDELKRQNRVGQLIWSRGHSVENYFFEFSVLRRGLRDYSVNRHFNVQSALDLFEINLEGVFQIACALSLAALNFDSISLVTSSLDWQHFKLSANQVEFDSALWGIDLKQKHKLDQHRTQLLNNDFIKWYNVTVKTEFEITRWLCHGHIGESVLWLAYCACLYEICIREAIPDPEKKVKNIAKRDRFIAFLTAWLQKTLQEGFQDTPLECLALLGIHLDPLNQE